MSGTPSLPVLVVRLGACVLVQANTSCNVWGNSTEYRRTPTEEDLSRAPQLVSVVLPTRPCHLPRAPGDEEKGAACAPRLLLSLCNSLSIRAC